MKNIFNDNTISYKSLGLYFAIESLLENGEEVTVKKLIENNKIIEVNHWSYTVIDNKKVILDQEKKIIGIVIEENK